MRRVDSGVFTMSISRGAKRKREDDRPCGDGSEGRRPAKQQKGATPRGPDLAKHALLSQYYPSLQTLRAYVLAKLPKSSRLRRRKISTLGVSHERDVSEAEAELGRFLDSTLVGTFEAPLTGLQSKAGGDDSRWGKWVDFSQKGDESYVTLSDGVSGAYSTQSVVG